MYECFHCGARAVIWDSDFDSEDLGYEEGGIVHTLHCANCGADIEYHVRLNPDKKEGADSGLQETNTETDSE